jgi:flagellar biosynthetic protein FliR
MSATWFADLPLPDVVVVAGVVARMATAVAAGVLPITSGVGVRVQAAVVLALTMAALPSAAAVSSLTGAVPILFVVLAEALVGLVLGLAAAAVFAAAGWAGGILGSVTGLSWADDFTPEGDPQAAGMARLAWWMGLGGFLAADGHVALVAGLVDSVRSLPVASAVAADGRFSESLASLATAMPTVALSLALTLALPALAAVLAFHLVAAICARTVPFEPGQGLLQASAALVLLAAVCIGTDSWIGGFAARVQAPLERTVHDIHP